MTTVGPSGEGTGAGCGVGNDCVGYRASKSPLCKSCSWLVYKHETGRCQAGFAHKVNMFGVFRKRRALTKENGKKHLRLFPGPHSDV